MEVLSTLSQLYGSTDESNNRCQHKSLSSATSNRILERLQQAEHDCANHE
jgi:hypothetical protein